MNEFLIRQCLQESIIMKGGDAVMDSLLTTKQRSSNPPNPKKTQ